MKLGKHTPTPWAVYELDPLVIVDDKGSSLGEMVPGDPHISHDEALANAALVVHAVNAHDASRNFAELYAKEGHAKLVLLEEVARLRELLKAIKKVRDGYAEQSKFADIEAIGHFREFIRRIDAVIADDWLASPSVPPSNPTQGNTR